MPRKSAAAKAINTPEYEPESVTLTAPRGMSKRATAIFKALIEASEHDHFEETDLPLLRQYCAACELAEQAEAALAKHGAVTSAGKASPWLVVQEKAHRAMTALSLRLSLAPQARKTGKRRMTPFEFQGR